MKKKYKIMLVLFIASCGIVFVVLLVLLMREDTSRLRKAKNYDKMQDSINVLNTMLLDCNNKFDNEITKSNQIKDTAKSINSIDILKQNITLLKEQKLDLKKQLETSDKAWQYYQNQYYHCIDKFNNEIK